MLFIYTETAKKIIIPESIAIKLANSSEVSAEYFFRFIYRRHQQYQAKSILYSNMTTTISNFTHFLSVLVALAAFFRIVLAFL